LNQSAVDLGPYEGDVAPDFRNEAFVQILRELPTHLPGDTGPQEEFRRSAVLRVELAGQPMAVKVFPAQNVARSRIAGTRGSKAKKSWVVARALQQNNIGTPRPIAFLERWQVGLLQESYFITDWLDEISSFNRQLLHLLHHEFDYDKILDLMNLVAAEVRRMHDAGVLHGDMGNQNITARRDGDSHWTDIGFIDLNRGRVKDELTLQERAFDISRVTLPSRLLKNFLSMYWRDRYHDGKRPPKEFMRHLRAYRRRFAFHSKTRALRHPIRTRRKRAQDPGKPRYPAPKDYWVWDYRTHQAIGMLMKRDKLGLTPVWPAVKAGLRSALAFPFVSKRFKKLRKNAFRSRVELTGGIGMTLTPSPDTVELEVNYLRDLGAKLPVLLRFYHHDSESARRFTIDLAQRLHAEGYPVSGAFIQSRKAITDPDGWRHFLHEVFEGVGDFLVEAELGHAINRVKWGLWSPEEYGALLKPWAEIHAKYPRVRLLGPAVNDFELQHAVAALGEVPRNTELDALSFHLYVDRRGAPENKQKLMGGAYDAVDKFTWARALAEKDVVISEVNWPLKDLGHYTHEFAPYFWHGNPSLDTTVTEDEYGWYMVRYYLLALCSGMVKRVYWWHLASPLFGLVDTTVDGWRARPAHAMLRTLLRHTEGATFVERVPSADEHYLLVFERAGSRFAIAWTNGGDVDLPLQGDSYENAVGASVQAPQLSQSPVYVFGLKP